MRMLSGFGRLALSRLYIPCGAPSSPASDPRFRLALVRLRNCQDDGYRLDGLLSRDGRQGQGWQCLRSLDLVSQPSQLLCRLDHTPPALLTASLITDRHVVQVDVAQSRSSRVVGLWQTQGSSAFHTAADSAG